MRSGSSYANLARDPRVRMPETVPGGTLDSAYHIRGADPLHVRPAMAVAVEGVAHEQRVRRQVVSEVPPERLVEIVEVVPKS